jgi:hypothetical protein
LGDGGGFGFWVVIVLDGFGEVKVFEEEVGLDEGESFVLGEVFGFLVGDGDELGGLGFGEGVAGDGGVSGWGVSGACSGHVLSCFS